MSLRQLTSTQTSHHRIDSLEMVPGLNVGAKTKAYTESTNL